MKTQILTLFLVASSLTVQPASAEPSPFADGKSAEECKAEYDKVPGYRVKSQKQNDQEACKGTVGESFCLADKEKAYIEQCKKSKAAKAPAKPVEVDPLQADPDAPLEETSEPKAKDEEKTGDGKFKEL